MLVLKIGHNPLYRHFYKCTYIELLKKLLFSKPPIQHTLYFSLFLALIVSAQFRAYPFV